MSKFLPTITQEQACQQARLFKALGDPTRIAILNLLRMHGGLMAVMDITANFHLEQPSISHHLSILRNAGLIDCTRKGLYVYYHIRGEAVAQAQASVAALREVVV